MYNTFTIRSSAGSLPCFQLPFVTLISIKQKIAIFSMMVVVGVYIVTVQVPAFSRVFLPLFPIEICQSIKPSVDQILILIITCVHLICRWGRWMLVVLLLKDVWSFVTQPMWGRVTWGRNLAVNKFLDEALRPISESAGHNAYLTSTNQWTADNNGKRKPVYWL